MAVRDELSIKVVKNVAMVKAKRAKKLGAGIDEASVYTEGGGLAPYKIYKPIDYRDGPEGFITWCEDFVFIPVYPEGSDIAVWVSIKNLPSEINEETGRSYVDIWEGQKTVIRDCLRMVNERFLYRVIVFCWPRGDGKSLLACLIQTWKFMCWPKQLIVLGANSKDQVKFVHFDIIRDIILNSPRILARVGKRNIQEKEIRIRDGSGNVASKIMAITSFSGIVSNITGYTFSEIFDMKNPKFFVQLDGSTRNIPNALGIIDSTVSSKQHILYNLFDSYTKGKSKKLFFSYRFSKKGDSGDYWNPNMSQDQIEDYRTKFPLGDFERYFLNSWSSGTEKIFSDEMLEAINYIGVNGVIGNHSDIMKVIKEKDVNREVKMSVESSGMSFNKDLYLDNLQKSFIPIEKYYSLKNEFGLPIMTDIQSLNKLGDLFDTDWGILCGVDRADPMKESKRGARTIVVCLAKGLPNSRSRPFLYDEEGVVASYIYCILHLAIIEDHSLEAMKDIILACNSEYDGIDVLCGERWGIWDLADWSLDNGIKFEALFPTYDRQKAAFTELFLSVSKGKFKSPPIPIWGSKQEDIFKEEASVFYHDPDKRWFGSPEKFERYGIQDDVIFSVGWAMYGGRVIPVSEFRDRKGKMWFGSFISDKSNLISTNDW